MIIAGDFNTTEEGMGELAESLDMEVVIPVGQEGVGTTVGNNRYDHFLITTDLADEEAVGCRIQTYRDDDTVWEVSDHLPVLAMFETDSAHRDCP